MYQGTGKRMPRGGWMGGCIISNLVCLAHNLFRNEVQISL